MNDVKNINILHTTMGRFKQLLYGMIFGITFVFIIHMINSISLPTSLASIVSLITYSTAMIIGTKIISI